MVEPEQKIQDRLNQVPAPGMPAEEAERTSISSTVAMFCEFRDALDDKYNRLERIIKLSRDITIESKRVIFQLHRVSMDPTALNKAAEKLHVIRERWLHQIALELDGNDKYYYIRAFTPGLQEFIEAYGFYTFLKHGTFPSYEDLQKDVLTFKVYSDTGYLCGTDKHSRQFSTARTGRNMRPPGNDERGPRQRQKYPRMRANNSAVPDTSDQNSAASTGPKEASEAPAPEFFSEADRESATGADNPSVVSEVVEQIEHAKVEPETKVVELFLPQTDYFLGLCDITGELMRVCIHAAANENKELAFKTCELIQRFYAGCVGLNTSKLYRKMDAMVETVRKMEYACYRLSIRDDKARPPLFSTFDDEVHGEDYDSGNEH